LDCEEEKDSEKSNKKCVQWGGQFSYWFVWLGKLRRVIGMGVRKIMETEGKGKKYKGKITSRFSLNCADFRTLFLK